MEVPYVERTLHAVSRPANITFFSRQGSPQLFKEFPGPQKRRLIMKDGTIMTLGSSMTSNFLGCMTPMVCPNFSTPGLFPLKWTFVQVTILQMLRSRATGVETWIASDGKAYFVQLNETREPDASASELGLADEGYQVDSVLVPLICWSGAYA
jgi:hypothetical protein